MGILIKSIVRNFFKHLNHNVINIIGICLGLTVITLCFLLVEYEFSFDKNFENVSNIYRIVREDKDNNGNITFAQGTSSELSPCISETLPEVLYSTRLFYDFVNVHQPNSTDIFNQPIAVVDKEFYKVFSLKFIEGSFETSLNKPFGVVLDRETADRIFKSEDPIGKSLIIQGFYFQGLLFEVTGVVQDLPRSTSINLGMITTENSFLPEWLWHSWQQTSGYLPIQTFVQVKKRIDIPDFDNKLNGLVKQHFEGEFQSKIKYHLQPLKRIHLYSNADYSIGSGGNINYIYFFLTLSILIMSIVAINFLNVSKTLFQSRMVEAGVKKVLGSSARGFIINFLLETMFLILICLPLTVLMVYLVIPFINQFINSNISIGLLMNSSVFIRYVLMLLFFALVIGVLPSVRFSLVNPVLLLSKQIKVKRKMFSNNVLMVVQFCIVIILIISTLHIKRQFNFLISKDLNFNKEHVILVPILSNDPSLRNRCEAVKESFLQNKDIVAATASHSVIGTRAERHRVKPGGHEEMDMLGIGVDADYIPFYGLKLIQGRNFIKNSGYDENSVILNKRAVEALGWDDAIGRTFDFRGRKGRVIGVVDDFNINGLDQEIKPAYLQQELPKNVLALKYKGNDLPRINQFIYDKQIELSPNNVPQSFFLTDVLQSQYTSEQRIMQIFGIFAVLAIVLSCLGLSGIVMEVCRSRVKEIGIRKVNGAKIREVMMMINNNFFKSILIAFIIAIPVAWYAMHQWLNSFAYRTNMSLWIFTLAGLMALGIALLTVSWQSWRAATRNPVEALRYE